jgi:hypothetical protein
MGINQNNSANSNRRTPSCSQTTRELDVLLLYGDAFGVNGAKIGVVEEVD